MVQTGLLAMHRSSTSWPRANPDVFLHAGTFLDTSSLAALEQACPFDPYMLLHLWDGIKAYEFANSAIWSNGGSAAKAVQQVLEASISSKDFVCQLKTLRWKMYFPALWRPWMTKTSDRSFTINPSLILDRSNWKPPVRACMPILLGAFRGQSMVVGVSIQAEGQVADNICVGLEADVCLEAESTGISMSLMFAPMSGKFFIQPCCWPVGQTMTASALPALDVAPKKLSVWIQLTESGAVRFLRQVEDEEPEDAGVIDCERLPPWITEFHACLYIWGQELQAAATVSIDHSADTFPPGFENKPITKMSMDWVSEGWEEL